MYIKFACKASDTKIFFGVIDFDVSLQRFHLQKQVAVIHTVRKVPLLLLFFFLILFFKT